MRLYGEFLFDLISISKPSIIRCKAVKVISIVIL